MATLKWAVYRAAPYQPELLRFTISTVDTSRPTQCLLSIIQERDEWIVTWGASSSSAHSILMSPKFISLFTVEKQSSAGMGNEMKQNRAFFSTLRRGGGAATSVQYSSECFMGGVLCHDAQVFLQRDTMY